MKHTYFLISILFASLAVQAQSTMGYAFTSGGSYGAVGNMVKTYFAKTYNDSMLLEIDSVSGDFSNAVVVNDHFIYVHIGRGYGHAAGDDRIYKYDISNLDSGAIDSSQAIAGIQKMQILNNQLVISRGFPATANFIQVLDKNNLQSVLYSDNSITTSCNGLALSHNMIYTVSTKNDTGRVEVISLDSGNWAYQGAYLLDSLSAGGAELFVDDSMAFITGKRYDASWAFMYAAVTQVNLLDSSYTSDTTLLSNAQAMSYISGMLLGNFGNPVESYITADGSRSTVLVAPNATALALDTLQSGFAVMNTDYFSFGALNIYDSNNTISHSFNCDISGTALSLATNYIPIANNDSVSSAVTSPDTLIIDVLANDTDVDHGLKTVEILTNPIYGTVAVESGKVLYMPYGSTTTATDSFTYAAIDAWGAKSNGALVHLDITVGVQPVQLGTLNVFPNPVHNKLRVTGAKGTSEYFIYNVSGVIVQKGTVSENDAIVTEDLTNGLYFISVKTTTNLQTKRFIKQ